MKKFESKLERLSRFEQILLAHPEGLSRSELARRLGIHRSTVSRYLIDTRHIFPLWENEGLIGINRDYYLSNVKLNIHEIMVLHLATRLFCCRTDKFNPHACSAMRKLGYSLGFYSKIISDHICSTADQIEKGSKKKDTGYISILETITTAWSSGYWTRLQYHSHKGKETHEYDFAPYFVQPYALGFSLYAIGLCRQKERVITLKIERIKHIALTKETFRIPDTFRPEVLFKDAWGIWYSDENPVEIELEFSPRVAERVSETLWHKSQVIERLEDGRLLWKASIAEPIELFPWIRGWGSDVKIVKPESLKVLMKEEVRKLGEMYGD
jgi:CRISPR-associated endonuclease/helicase Cas3